MRPNLTAMHPLLRMHDLTSFRCIVHTSRMVRPWGADELEILALAAKSKNQKMGITGRLLVLQDSFVHALEGPPQAVSSTLYLISQDPRHTDIQALVDTPVKDRKFSDWTLDLATPSDTRLTPYGSHFLEAPGLAAPPASHLAEAEIEALFSKVDRPFLEWSMRATPIQARARRTVERILQAAERISRSKGEPPAMQDIVDATEMPQAAVYRYFSGPESIVGVLVRLHALKRHEQFHVRLKQLQFSSIEELASDTADYISRNYIVRPDISGRLIHIILRDYHRIAYSELWTLAGEMQTALKRNGFGVHGRPQQDRIAMALGAAAGYAKMAALQAPSERKSPHFVRGLENILLNGLTSGGD